MAGVSVRVYVMIIPRYLKFSTCSISIPAYVSQTKSDQIHAGLKFPGNTKHAVLDPQLQLANFSGK